jgi:hypothetical protein
MIDLAYVVPQPPGRAEVRQGYGQSLATTTTTTAALHCCLLNSNLDIHMVRASKMSDHGPDQTLLHVVPNRINYPNKLR